MGDTSAYLDMPVPVLPTCATIWPNAGQGEWEAIEDLTAPSDIERLRAGAAAGGTVWVETRVDVDGNKDQREWLEGEFPVWSPLPTPRIFWRAMAAPLEALGLEAPAQHREDGESGSSKLLRALPFAYSRGAFGTVRDALFESSAVDELTQAAKGDPLTTFPTVGFMPGNSDPGNTEVLYTALHATVGVVGNTVVSVRLPDTFCPTLGEERAHASPWKLVPADVLSRFLPQGRTASGREVAEAIGMHQATSARAIAAEIRRRLEDVEDVAGQLNDEDAPNVDEKPQFKKKVNLAAKRIDELAEVAQHLDRNLSTILRRFSGKISDAPEAVQELAPLETKRRYSFALDNVRALHEDCRLASQIVRHELSTYEHSQRERFQFIAAVLASVVLIPTLIASILGVNLGVPGQNSRVGFAAFVIAIAGLCIVGYSALRTAGEHHWSPPANQLRMHLGMAAGILIALVIVLLLVS
jgi:CorA-like Mg2+ transporter protein